MWFEPFFNIYLYAGSVGTKNKGILDQFKNAISFQNTFSRLLTDAMHRYTIDGLPDTCSERVVLQSLIWYANVVFFEKQGNLLALPGAPSGSGYNANGDPGSAWIWARNGKLNEEVTLYLPGEDASSYLKKTSGYNAPSEKRTRGVIVWENGARYPFLNQIVYYSQAIADTYRTIDVGRQNLKCPYIIVAEEEVIPTVKKFFEKVDSNESRILSSGTFPTDKISVLPITVPTDTLSSATTLVEWYESKFRELCGIDSNSQQDKKGENLVTAEISVNDEYQEQELDKCLKYINEGLENVNKLFGTNMKARANKDDYDKDILRNESGDNRLISDDSTDRPTGGNK